MLLVLYEPGVCLRARFDPTSSEDFLRQPRPTETPAPSTTTRALSIACRALAVFCLGLGVLDQAGAAEVAILKTADLAAYNQAVAGFKAAMPSSTTFVEYDMKGSPARGQDLAQKIRKSDAALLLAVGVKAAQVAKLEVPDIPVVFCMVLDPDKHDLKAPNMTGIRLEIPIERQLNTIRTVLPSLKRLGVLYDPEKTGLLVETARRQAKSMGMELIVRQVRTDKDVPGVLLKLLPQVDALWLIPDSTVVTEETLQFVMSAALDSNLPVIGFSSELVRSGALLGMSVNYEDIGRQAGLLARKILNDRASPFSNTYFPERLRLSLNLKAAKFLGITIPPAVVDAADELY
jgi:putative ABC transport system substrate-binding protein